MRSIDYHLNTLHWDKGISSRTLWGDHITTEEQVWNLFVRYVTGELPRLPWSDAALAPETEAIRAQLVKLNSCGFLTINSQPKVNAARSDHPVHGWGGPGGYVFQKVCAIIVFACLLTRLRDRRTWNSSRRLRS